MREVELQPGIPGRCFEMPLDRSKYTREQFNTMIDEGYIFDLRAPEDKETEDNNS